MSLYINALEDFTVMTKTTVSDGYGGFSSEWQESEETFLAAAVYDSSLEARTAAVQGVTSLYTITTRKDTVLEYHAVIKRVSDGKIFRVTSDSKDKQTPPTAGLNMRKVNAEEFILPS